MKAKMAIVGWTPKVVTDRTSGCVKVVRFPDAKNRLREYFITEGAGSDWWRAASAEEQLARVLKLFNLMVVHSGIDPMVAHSALLGIDEYRDIWE